jgi:hypothetical protein
MHATGDADVPVAPAPWTLRARGYILVLRLPDALREEGCFIPETLRASAGGGFSYAMFLDYEESPVGPYRELLLIPCAFRFGDRKHWSITKIYVSTQASVVNGRRNWGIPKELADFDVRYGEDRVDEVTMRVNGEPAVELALRHLPLGAPLLGGLFPDRMRSLAQELAGTRFTFSPSAKGSLKLAKLVEARIDPRFFPAFSPNQVLAATKVTSLAMTFPVPQVEAIP